MFGFGRTVKGGGVEQFWIEQSHHGFNYSPIGITKAKHDDRFVRDHNRIELGIGEDTFEQACDAIRNWQMFNLGWVQIYPTNAPIAEGTTVAMWAHALGFWFFNGCRIVYTVDEREGDLWRFGFAYGTLPAHIARGEERFLIEWDRRDDSVHYDILAYSQPNALIAKVGYPVVRHFQKRFAQDSKRAMIALHDKKFRVPSVRV